MWVNRLCFFYLVITLSCANLQADRNSNFPSETKYLDVCEVTNNIASYNNKVIKLKGKFKGFHQLVLFSDECPGEKNIILLDASYSYFLESPEYSKVPKPSPGENNEINGEIFLQGKIEKDAGTVFNYGKYISDIQTGKVSETPKDIIVSRITNLEIDKFDFK